MQTTGKNKLIKYSTNDEKICVQYSKLTGKKKKMSWKDTIMLNSQSTNVYQRWYMSMIKFWALETLQLFYTILKKKKKKNPWILCLNSNYANDSLYIASVSEPRIRNLINCAISQQKEQKCKEIKKKKSNTMEVDDQNLQREIRQFFSAKP